MRPHGVVVSMSERGVYARPDFIDTAIDPAAPTAVTQKTNLREMALLADRSETLPANRPTTEADASVDWSTESNVSNQPALQPLFRAEALEARRVQWLGSVLLVPRLSNTLFATFAIVSIAFLVALLAFGEFTRKAHVNGWLVPKQGLVRVFAPQVGVVSELKVAEGTHVRQGDPLAVLSAERQSAMVGATEAEISRLLASRRDSLERELVQQQQLFAQQHAGLALRLRAIRDEIAQFDNEIAVQSSRRDLAAGSADRLRELGHQGFASKMQVQQQEEIELDQRGRLRSLQRTRSERRRELSALQAEYNDLPFKARAQAATLERSISELGQESAASEARRTLIILAPQSGTVTAVQTPLGSNAGTVSPMLSIVPDGSKLQAHLFAPSRSIGFLRPGQEVLLRYQAFPYQKFGHHIGRIVSVSNSALSPSDLPVQQAGLTSLVGTGEPVYQIVVDLEQQQITAYGEARPLQPGMQVESDVLLERRKLYEWLLEPLFTLTGKW